MDKSKTHKKKENKVSKWFKGILGKGKKPVRLDDTKCDDDVYENTPRTYACFSTLEDGAPDQHAGAHASRKPPQMSASNYMDDVSLTDTKNSETDSPSGDRRIGRTHYLSESRSQIVCEEGTPEHRSPTATSGSTNYCGGSMSNIIGGVLQDEFQEYKTERFKQSRTKSLPYFVTSTNSLQSVIDKSAKEAIKANRRPSGTLTLTVNFTESNSNLFYDVKQIRDETITYDEGENTLWGNLPDKKSSISKNHYKSETEVNKVEINYIAKLHIESNAPKFQHSGGLTKQDNVVPLSETNTGQSLDKHGLHGLTNALLVPKPYTPFNKRIFKSTSSLTPAGNLSFTEIEPVNALSFADSSSVPNVNCF